MNYILHLNGFFQRISADNRLNPTHVSLYMAMFQYWNAGRFKNPVSISRQELMRISKICAKATYHKCIKDLHNYGYINYEPSYNPYRGSLVYMFDFQTSAKPLPVRNNTNIEASIEQAVAPYINNINDLKENSENETSTQNDIVVKVSNHKAVVIEANGEKIPEKKSGQDTKSEFPPPIEKIKEYFQEQKAPEIEAQKFFNYFQSNGWKVGGKTAMQDWQASARNWILNISQFTTQKEQPKRQELTPGNLSTTTGKDYSEPL